MKEFIKKSWRYLIFIPIITIIVVGILLNLPKHQDDLNLEIGDFTLKVGERVEVDYQINSVSALTTLKIEDNDVAVLDDNYILGLSEGITKLIVTAEKENIFVSKSVNVNVLPIEQEVDEPEEDTEISVKCFNEEISEINLNVGEPIVLEITANSDFNIIVSKAIDVEEIFSIKNNFKVTANNEGEYEMMIVCGDIMKSVKLIVN